MTGAPVDTLLVFVHVPAGAIAAFVGAGAMKRYFRASAHTTTGKPGSFLREWNQG